MNETNNESDTDGARSRQPAVEGGVPTSGKTTTTQLLRTAAPTVVVLAALAVLAAWGHHAGWTLPRFSALMGGSGVGIDDWCEEHAVPESVCVECDPKLMPRGQSHGWCKVHGVHECPLEHPDVAQLQTPPRITAADLERARHALDFAVRPANSPKCQIHSRRIQFVSDEAVRRAGIEVGAAWQQPVRESVAAPGEVATRVAKLSSPLPGKISSVQAEVGSKVLKGDVLALVDAAEVGKAKGELLHAIAMLDARSKVLERQRKLAEMGATSAASVAKAEAEVTEAQIRVVAAQQALINLGLPVAAEKLKGLSPEELGRRIQFLGLPPALAKTLNPETTSANLVPVMAPMDGVVAARKVAAGEQVDSAKVLFIVADPQQIWLTLRVRQEDAKLLRARDSEKGAAGQAVKFLAGGSDREASAEVVWISGAVDEKTRTVEVRAEFTNPESALRVGTFGSGRIILREEKRAVVVPTEAIQWEGDCHVVFVRDKDYESPGAFKVFHTRTVRPGARDGSVTEIIAGVLPGEVVVTQGSGLLRSELLKNNFGEG